MRRSFRGCFGLLLLFNACFHHLPDAIGQIRHRLSNLRIEMGTGYDTNLFQIADRSDSNRVEAPIETLQGRLSSLVYWKRGIVTNISTSGGYSYYPNNAFANEWQWSAKAKTSFAIKRRPGGFSPAMDLNIAWGAMQVDKIFTSRELGGESLRDVNDKGLEKIGLGDLFDRISYFFGGGMEFEFGKRSSLSVGYNHEVKDYKNIGDPATPNFYSLDNVENNVEADFDIKLSKPCKIKLRYDGQDRQYEYKLARDSNGAEIPDERRRYWTNAYGLGIYWNSRRVGAKIGASLEQRQDQFEGYYNSLQTQLVGDFKLAVSASSQIFLGLERGWKDYEHVEISGNVLSNRSFTFKAGISFSLRSDLALHTSFIHDRESSTFETFSHRRNIGIAILKYSIN